MTSAEDKSRRRKGYPGWGDDARRLRSEGLSPDQISESLGVWRSIVLLELNENGERERERKRIRRNPKGAAPAKVPNAGIHKLVEPWKPKPRPKRERPNYTELCKAYSAGTISKERFYEALRA